MLDDISFVCSELLSWSGESTVLVPNLVELEVVLMTSGLAGESCVVVLSDCDGVHQLRVRCVQLRTSTVDDNTLWLLIGGCCSICAFVSHG